MTTKKKNEKTNETKAYRPASTRGKGHREQKPDAPKTQFFPYTDRYHGCCETLRTGAFAEPGLIRPPAKRHVASALYNVHANE